MSYYEEEILAGELSQCEVKLDTAREENEQLRDDLSAAQQESARLNKVREHHLQAIATLRAALLECEEYFDDRADAEQVSGRAGYRYNEEARLLDTVRRALGK